MRPVKRLRRAMHQLLDVLDEIEARAVELHEQRRESVTQRGDEAA